jgi:hypothetical protein
MTAETSDLVDLLGRMRARVARVGDEGRDLSALYGVCRPGRDLVRFIRGMILCALSRGHKGTWSFFRFKGSAQDSEFIFREPSMPSA